MYNCKHRNIVYTGSNVQYCFLAWIVALPYGETFSRLCQFSPSIELNLREGGDLDSLNTLISL